MQLSKLTVNIISNIIGAVILIIGTTILIIILKSFCIQENIYTNIDTIIYGSVYDSKDASINASIYSIMCSGIIISINNTKKQYEKKSIFLTR
jgi:hypothetical protein